MLRHKHRMPSKGSLFAVVDRCRRRQPLVDKIMRMFDYRRHAFCLQICPLTRRKPETPAECGVRQGAEYLIQLFHDTQHCSHNRVIEHAGLKPAHPMIFPASARCGYLPNALFFQRSHGRSSTLSLVAAPFAASPGVRYVTGPSRIASIWSLALTSV
jgi:hypothetical protein